MLDGLGNQLAHGHPGTPVSDLFPLRNAVLGNGNRSSLRPIWAGELRSHSALCFSLLFVSVSEEQSPISWSSSLFQDRKLQDFSTFAISAA